MKKILFSGIKPTGELHLGNYLGALRNWVALQSSYQTIYSVADYHALTIDIDPKEIRANTMNLAVDLLALGIDPKKSILFRQSDVIEHTELTWFFACLTPVAELERMTQYKDMIKEQRYSTNAGLFTYPILQAADILLYRAAFVPVGEDQLQHLELSRVIARKFNKRYGNFFPEIQPIVTEEKRVMALNNPEKKMSKSLGAKSYIALRDKPEIIREKISKAVTDSLETSNTLTGGHNLLMLYKNFGPKDRFDHFMQEYELKKISYSVLKKELAESIITFLRPIQKKQEYYDARPKEVQKILADGARRARKIAQKNITAIRVLIGLGERW